ncbi:unnamed protein product [Linum tenue]|uniref:Rhamnogalacturonan endolyase n=1 Tax=Linum tenue TaxID=586396 RepID=A0AAV0NZD7_9ROSI|nr:unnamed protein product [Linum tenue]
MSTQQGVKLQIESDHVVLDNGMLKLTISKPQGMVTGIQYNGVTNLLESRNDEIDRGISGTSFSVIVENEEQVEVSFKRTWDPSLEGQLPSLIIDKRFIMLKNSSGFYSYGIFEHLAEWSPFNLPQVRIVFKLSKDKFHYMAVSDNRQRFMPLPDDRSEKRSKPLAYPEAVLLVNPVEPEFKGEVDDKYQYSCENKDLKVHGWICSDPTVGFWQITPSNEFRTGGLVKQNLTSHVGPINLAMFLSAHYAGDEMVLKLKPGEPWKKVLGPVFMHLNTTTDGRDPLSLWEDAKRQMAVEVQSWPYSFPASEDFPKAEQRGRISGRFLVHDWCVSETSIPGNGGYVGLAPPGEVGSWQTDGKGYQFWTQADEQGSSMDMGDVVYEPPRHGPTLWEMGYPDRTASGFYVPDVDPKYINKLYVNHPDSRFRQYGLWDRYTELYPDKDVVYTVGKSDWAKDWFYAHIPRRTKEGEYVPTTWQIKFYVDSVGNTSSSNVGDYLLRVAVATAHVAELQVRINNQDMSSSPLFSTGVIGHDNTIGRHGIHGLYRLYEVLVPAALLSKGENIFYFTQTQTKSPATGIMYDYIRLEAPPSSPHCLSLA